MLNLSIDPRLKKKKKLKNLKNLKYPKNERCTESNKPKVVDVGFAKFTRTVVCLPFFYFCFKDI